MGHVGGIKGRQRLFRLEAAAVQKAGGIDHQPEVEPGVLCGGCCAQDGGFLEQIEIRLRSAGKAGHGGEGAIVPQGFHQRLAEAAAGADDDGQPARFQAVHPKILVRKFTCFALYDRAMTLR